MKVAWLIGSFFSENIISQLSINQKSSGGWVYTQIMSFINKEEIEEIHVISVNDGYSQDGYFCFGKIHAYLIKDKPICFFVNKGTVRKIDKYLLDNNIDILDVQGTETTISSYPVSSNIKFEFPIISTIHGLAFQCYKFYSTGLPFGFLLWGRSLSDWFTFHGVLEGKLLMKRRAHIENMTLKGINYVRGRTSWDKMSVRSINEKVKYFHTELIMREPFYQGGWDIDLAIPYKIFVPQMRIPYKGMFILLKAIKLVKQDFPDIKVFVPGDRLRQGIKSNGYEQYIWRLINEYDLRESIVFTGNLNAEEMVKELQSSRVFVLPSIIENSPNSLTEAQLIGTPTVSSLVGGVSDYVVNGETGLLYNSQDYIMCAECIIRLLSDNDLSNKISKQARLVACKRHEPEQVTDTVIKCYKDVICDFGLLEH